MKQFKWMWNAHSAVLYLPWWPQLQSFGRLWTSTHERGINLHPHASLGFYPYEGISLTTVILYPITITSFQPSPYLILSSNPKPNL